MLAELENLFALQDKNYREFHARLMPNIEKERIIGIRVPVLRKYAKELAHGSRLFLSVQKEKRVCNTVKENDCDNVEKFLNTLPHYYYEENNLHMFLIMQMKDYDTALAYLEAFLPYIDNWATCDSGVPAVFKKHKNELLLHVYKWLDSDKPYTVRYGIGTLMRLYLDEDFDIKYALDVAKIRSEEYYVNMMKRGISLRHLQSSMMQCCRYCRKGLWIAGATTRRYKKRVRAIASRHSRRSI